MQQYCEIGSFRRQLASLTTSFHSTRKHYADLQRRKAIITYFCHPPLTPVNYSNPKSSKLTCVATNSFLIELNTHVTRRKSRLVLET